MTVILIYFPALINPKPEKQKVTIDYIFRTLSYNLWMNHGNYIKLVQNNKRKPRVARIFKLFPGFPSKLERRKFTCFDWKFNKADGVLYYRLLPVYYRKSCKDCRKVNTGNVRVMRGTSLQTICWLSVQNKTKKVIVPDRKLVATVIGDLFYFIFKKDKLTLTLTKYSLSLNSGKILTERV